jgi:RNA polymerase sigma-70 factor (ECF subfamily)
MAASNDMAAARGIAALNDTAARHTDDLAWDWPAIRVCCAREARRIVRDPYDAEEVVQEALVRAWRRRNTYRGSGAVLSWCLQITRNEAFRLLARRRAQAVIELHADLELDARSEPAATEQLIARIDLSRAIRCLDPQDRLLITLRYASDLSQADVARALELPEGTVKVRLHRARKRLRAGMREER